MNLWSGPRAKAPCQINTDGEVRQSGQGSRLETGVLQTVNDAGPVFVITPVNMETVIKRNIFMETAANALSLPPAWYSRKADTQTTRPSVGKRKRGMLSNPPLRVTPYHVLNNHIYLFCMNIMITGAAWLSSASACEVYG